MIITENQAKKLIKILSEDESLIGGIQNVPSPSQISIMASMANGGGIDELMKKIGPEAVEKLKSLLGVNGLSGLLGLKSSPNGDNGVVPKTNNTSNSSNNSNAALSNPLGNQPFKMGGGLGATRSHGPHQGVDLMVKTGTPVYAPADGVILKSHDDGGTCGGFVKIDHGNVITKYCHLVKWVAVPGAQVKKGEIIGYVGGGANDPYHGNSSISHLHYEIWDKNNNLVLNPQQSQFGLA